MEKKNEVSIALVIINCLCAVVWSINVVIDLTSGVPDTTSFLLHLFCAIAWDVCAVMWVLRYLKEKKNRE